VRSRLILLAGAVFLAAVHVTGVLFGSPIWPPALVGALLLLATLGGPPRWLGPIALAPLILQAALTVPRVHTGGYQWLSVDSGPARPSASALTLDALDAGFRVAGAPLLLAAVLLLAVRADESAVRADESAVRADESAVRADESAVRAKKSAWGSRAAAAGALLTGFLILAYAVVRVVALDRRDPSRGAGTFAAAVLVPVALALTAAVLGAMILRHRRQGPPALGALLLAASTLPMIDSGLDALPTSYQAFGSDDPTRLFGWDFITPSIALPAPVPALTVGLQLAGFLLLVAGAKPPRCRL
jgi:hypothetical protein